MTIFDSGRCGSSQDPVPQDDAASIRPVMVQLPLDRLLRIGLTDEEVERVAGVTLSEILVRRAVLAVASPHAHDTSSIPLSCGSTVPRQRGFN